MGRHLDASAAVQAMIPDRWVTALGLASYE
jgi:hypothetical protein